MHSYLSQALTKAHSVCDSAIGPPTPFGMRVCVPAAGAAVSGGSCGIVQWSTCAVWALRVHLHAGVKGSRLIVAVHVVCTPLTNTAGVLLLLLLQFADVYAFGIMSEWLQLPRSFHTG